MNMIDYLKWRGDIDMKTDPFNEVDNMLIAQMTYVDMDEIFAAHKSLTIKEISDLYFSSHDLEEAFNQTSYFFMSPMVMYLMAQTERFKDLRVYNYVSTLDPESAEQFAAEMVDLPDKTTVICFEGTDDTIIGWKEDLMLSYTEIPSQKKAADYLDHCTNPFRKYRVIGHSKGGHLALYAATHCKESVRKRIVEVISNDGPGMRPGSYDEEVFESIQDRYRLIVPEKDGVGTIYEMGKNRKIVLSSNANLVSSHSMMTWEVERNALQEADRNNYETELNRQSLLRFLNETTPEQREVFVKELFDRFEEAGVTTVTQLSNLGLSFIPKALKKFGEMNEESRQLAGQLIKTYSGKLGSDAYHTISDKAGNLVPKRRPRKEKEEDIEEEEGE